MSLDPSVGIIRSAVTMKYFSINGKPSLISEAVKRVARNHMKKRPIGLVV